MNNRKRILVGLAALSITGMNSPAVAEGAHGVPGSIRTCLVYNTIPGVGSFLRAYIPRWANICLN